MTINDVLKYDAEYALESINDVIKNPAAEKRLSATEMMALKDARKVLDKLVTKLKKVDVDLKL